MNIAGIAPGTVLALALNLVFRVGGTDPAAGEAAGSGS